MNYDKWSDIQSKQKPRGECTPTHNHITKTSEEWRDARRKWKG